MSFQLDATILQHPHGPKILIACSSTGLRAVMMGDSSEMLYEACKTRFGDLRQSASSPLLRSSKDALIRLLNVPTAPFDVPLDIQGTLFQHRVWAALKTISPGTTTTYGALAEKIGQSSAVRAVAGACGANPVAVVVPCHRVIGHNGALTGFNYGIERKKALLEREGITVTLDKIARVLSPNALS